MATRAKQIYQQYVVADSPNEVTKYQKTNFDLWEMESLHCQAIISNVRVEQCQQKPFVHAPFAPF